MRLSYARQIAKKARKQGKNVTLANSSEACNLHDPSRSRMTGASVVIEHYQDGNSNATRYIWE